MKFEDMEVPDEHVNSSLDELRTEVAAVKEWYEVSKKSLDLIQATVERPLEKEEALKVARDFLTAGLLMASMTARSEAIVNAANSVISKNAVPDVLAKFEELLRDEGK